MCFLILTTFKNTGRKWWNLQVLFFLVSNERILIACSAELKWELGHYTESYPSAPMHFMDFIQYIKSRLYESDS